MAVAPAHKLLIMVVCAVAASGTGAALLPVTAKASWCVARSEASDDALQRAMDYACWAGADCGPIQPDGLCYLPNTFQAHASFAFNSYFQRRSMAPGTCDFAGTATIAKSDPSYGSCDYPSSLGAAGGPVTPGTAGQTNPGTNVTTAPPFDGNGGSNQGLGPSIGDEASASSSTDSMVMVSICASLLTVLSLNLQPLLS